MTYDDREKILIFKNETYKVKLENLLENKAQFSINNQNSPYMGEHQYSLGNLDELYLTVDHINYISRPGENDNSSVTLIVSKQFNLTKGDKIDFKFYEEPGISLEDAEVTIICNKTEKGYRNNGISTYFKLKNNRNEQFNSTMYLKADGFSCYGDCEPMREDEFESSIFLDINDENYYDTFLIDIEDEKYVAFNYSFDPLEEIDIEIGYEMALPFRYYLDSLSSYQSAKHEKIIIEGYCDAEFNEYYPVELISEHDNYKVWVWEYSDINTFDENLKDVLIVTESALPDCTPNWECGEWFNYTCDPDFEPLPEYMGGAPDIEISGKMYRSCYDGCGHSKVEHQDCLGTVLNNSCEILGQRKPGEYCSSENLWEPQKSVGDFCEENFECRNNNCIDDKCKSKSSPNPNLIYWIIGIILAVTLILTTIIIVLVVLSPKKK